MFHSPKPFSLNPNALITPSIMPVWTDTDKDNILKVWQKKHPLKFSLESSTYGKWPNWGFVQI